MRRRDPYRQYRRNMRRDYGARHGRYPVVMLGDPGYQPLGIIALAALSRSAYRHRSAFAPFAVTGTAFFLANLGHRDRPGLWVAAAVVTAAVAFVLGIPHRLLWSSGVGKMTAGVVTRAWEACGIPRPAERAYAATVTAVAGGWLSAGIADGPAVRPLPVVAAIATVILGIPWWAHRRRRAKVRIERTVQAWPGMAENMGLPGSRIASATGDAWGFTARVVLRKGTTAAQAISQVPAIESGLGIRPGSARALPDPGRADRFILRVIERDPHAQPVPWPGQPDTSISRPADIGLFEDGRPVTVALLRRNVLIGGTTGSGKSGVLNVILAFLAACGDVIIWGIDLKGGMELRPWVNCLTRLATTPDEAAALLRDAAGEVDRRAAGLAGQGKRVWEPAPGSPALIIVTDEYAELPAGALEHADSVARRGRAVAVNLLAATQRPTQEAMGGNAVRSQMDTRICLRVRERRDVDLILGQGSFTAGWHAHALTAPGALLLSDPEHTAPERARAYLITDDQVTRAAARHGRPPGPPPTVPAWPQRPGAGHPGTSAREPGETALWAALSGAGPDGLPVAALLAVTDMSRATLYRHLKAHAAAGRVAQTARGHWRAAGPPGGDAV